MGAIGHIHGSVPLLPGKQPPLVDINYLSHDKVERDVCVKAVMKFQVAQKAKNATSPMTISISWQ